MAICPACQGTKKIECFSCHGRKAFDCDDCSGIGMTTCFHRQFNVAFDMFLPNNECESCKFKNDRCDRQGNEFCSKCNGNGYLICKRCNGSGDITCFNCGGTGDISEAQNRESFKEIHKKQPSSSCFFATAIYQDINASEVQLLRRFRDEVLVRNFVGRIFVTLYYAGLGKTLAKIVSYFGEPGRFACKSLMKPIIRQLALR